MRYLSGVVMPDGTREKQMVHVNWEDFNFVLEVTTLETGAVEVVTPDKNELAGKVYGVNFGLLPQQSAFVTHTKKQALLYRHIDYAISSAHRNQLAFFGADIITLTKPRGGHNLNPKNRNLAIDALNCEYKLGGIGGSVCAEYITLADKLFVYNLYDFLLEICDQTGVNIFKYEMVTLFSNDLKYSTTIKLSQKPEAQRFYTKMCLDIGSQRREWPT